MKLIIKIIINFSLKYTYFILLYFIYINIKYKNKFCFTVLEKNNSFNE